MRAKAQKRERISTMDNNFAALIQANDIANMRAEEALLGAVLHHPEIFPVLAEMVEPQDFFDLFNGYVWHTFQQLQAHNVGIDLVTVGDELAKQNRQNDMRLIALTQAAPDIQNAEHYARLVRDSSIRIRILAAASDISQYIVANRTMAIDQIIDESNRLLFVASEQKIDESSTLMEVVSREVDRIEDIIHGVVPRGCPTGFFNLNRILHAFSPGELNILAGSEGMGKTTMLLSMIHNLLLEGKRVLFFTLEMSQQDLIRILAAMESGIPKDTLKVGHLNLDEWSGYMRAMGDIARWPLTIIDEFPALSPLQMRRKWRKLVALEGSPFDLVVVDGLWLMDASEIGQERSQSVFSITREVITISREFTTPVLMTHQYNGEAHKRKDKTPTVFDLAESAAVRRNAQVILGMYRDAYYGIDSAHDLTQMFVLKDRTGNAQGRICNYMFERSRNRYMETDPLG